MKLFYIYLLFAVDFALDVKRLDSSDNGLVVVGLTCTKQHVELVGFNRNIINRSHKPPSAILAANNVNSWVKLIGPEASPNMESSSGSVMSLPTLSQVALKSSLPKMPSLSQSIIEKPCPADNSLIIFDILIGNLQCKITNYLFELGDLLGREHGEHITA